MKSSDRSLAMSGELHRKLKIASALQGRTMQKIAEEAIEKALKERKQRQGKQ
jgi:predicted DNA-binding protein